LIPETQAGGVYKLPGTKKINAPFTKQGLCPTSRPTGQVFFRFFFDSRRPFLRRFSFFWIRPYDFLEKVRSDKISAAAAFGRQGAADGASKSWNLI
jgi:hypothetical protein